MERNANVNIFYAVIRLKVPLNMPRQPKFRSFCGLAQPEPGTRSFVPKPTLMSNPCEPNTPFRLSLRQTGN